MNIVYTVLFFILVISLVIFIHEFGHFLLAKKNGIGVVEFSIGFGPKMFSWIRKGTRYVIRWIPIGGYCRMLGDEAMADEEEDTDEAIVHEEENYFTAKSVWARIAVIAAGPIFNFFLALFLSLLLVSLIGSSTTKIGGIATGYPAEKAGLSAGDRIIKLDHTRVHLFEEITFYLSFHDGETITVVYEHNGEEKETVLTPVYNEEEDRYLIGINTAGRETDFSVFEVLKYGWYNFTYNTGLVIKSLGMLFTGKTSINDLSGPVGIGGAIHNIVTEVEKETEEDGFFTTLYWLLINLINFTVVISANLGVINLLPIPGMDGGRLIFLFIEAIRGKPIEKKKEGIVTFIGFLLLLLLIAFVFFNDIRKVFFG